jgi:hypothetical protein
LDIVIHWAVFRRFRHEAGAAVAGIATEIIPGVVVLTAFAALTWQSAPLTVVVSISLMGVVLLFERLFLRRGRVDTPLSEASPETHPETWKDKPC